MRHTLDEALSVEAADLFNLGARKLHVAQGCTWDQPGQLAMFPS